MAQRGSFQREYIIRVTKSNEDKRFSILKFNDTRNVDPLNWANTEVLLTREENRREVMAGVSEQDYGEGSVYGRAAREEARRKKYGRRRREYQHDAQPWILSIGGQKLRSIQEGGAGEYADYWVFLKVGDGFQAHKISDWHQFLPCITHKTLDSEQAEEKFQLRDKVMNQFALKAQIMKELKEQDTGVNLMESKTSLKIKDERSSDEDDYDRSLDTDGQRKSASGKSKLNNKKKDKRQRVENPEDVAAYESEDGQDEGREYDYISDSGSDSDREEKTLEEKVEEALVGVGDESGLKGLIGSDLDTTSEDEDDDEDVAEKNANTGGKTKKAVANVGGSNSKDGIDVEEKESSGSDSDDLDSENINSVFFMQRKDIRKRPTSEEFNSLGGIPSQSSSSSALDNAESLTKRAKIEAPCDMPVAPLSAHSAADVFDEDVVRRLLLRKPHTTKELLDKVKPRCGSMTKNDIVSKLAAILKKIEPYRFRQRINDKDVLYFSLNQTC